MMIMTMKNMILRKINSLCRIVILFGLVLIASCNQDAIFFIISTETAPIEPIIPGAPTNMAEFSREYPDPDDENTTIEVRIMYVASGNLHWYAKAGRGTRASRWDSGEYRIPQPGGKVIGLAATDKHLYALCIIGSGVSTRLRRIGPSDSAWETVSPSNTGSYTLIQTIYATGTGRLFAGARNNSGSDYGILYLDDASDPPALKLLQGDTEMLSGAASLNGFHYLSTIGKGVYKVAETAIADPDSSVEQLGEEGNPDGKKNRLFMGMIQLVDEKIIMVERDGGRLFAVQAEGFTQIPMSTGRYATGALALWEGSLEENGELQRYKILVAGIQGGLSTTTSSSYTHGYVEFILNDDGSLNPDSNCIDPPSITVRRNTDRYTATIGKHPINHMHQASPEVDANMTFFASTQTAGLWSYRNRSSGGWQWNAED